MSEILENYVVHATWSDVDEYLNQIVEMINHEKRSGVYGIPRGGLVLASWLAHKLYVPLLFAPSPNCIIIDDICDSGETLLHYIKNSSNPDAENNYFITTMFYRANNDFGVAPDFYFKEKHDKWIVFPWEE